MRVKLRMNKYLIWNIFVWGCLPETQEIVKSYLGGTLGMLSEEAKLGISVLIIIGLTCRCVI